MSIRRGVARTVSLYERAPLRVFLDLDWIGALDWIVVASGRRIARALDARSAATFFDGADLHSGWRGNLVFLCFWAAVVVGGTAVLKWVGFFG